MLIGISVISFALMYLSPSDPAQMMLAANGTAPTEELLAQVRHEMGLDLPAYQQYLDWMGGLLTGDLGYSCHYAKSVAGVFAARLPLTVALALASMLPLVDGERDPIPWAETAPARKFGYVTPYWQASIRWRRTASPRLKGAAGNAR